MTEFTSTFVLSPAGPLSVSAKAATKTTLDSLAFWRSEAYRPAQQKPQTTVPLPWALTVVTMPSQPARASAVIVGPHRMIGPSIRTWRVCKIASREAYHLESGGLFT